LHPRLLGSDFDNRAELRRLAKGLKDFDPTRFEAMLHAWPEGWRLPAAPLDVMERCDQVEEGIERFSDLGLTTPFADVFDVFISAKAELSGRSKVEALDDHFDGVESRDGLRVVS
jgi:hypothetical protein